MPKNKNFGKYEHGGDVMTEFTMFELLDGFNSFSRKDLKEKIDEKQVEVSDSTITRFLSKMIKEGIIQKSKNYYNVVSDKIKNNYKYIPSDKLREIRNLIKETYPYVEFEVWEYVQLNDFVNHLIGKNSFIVETEKDFEMAIFELLNEHYPRVLLNPDYDMFSLYSMDEPIVVKRLISRTPKNKITPYQPTLEKLLVDLIQDSFTSKLINTHELKRMIKICDEDYFIDYKSMKTYAKRRNAQEKLDEYLKEIEE